ncbi:2-hydroxychromene-2-carboxylate isomerase [Polaromonas sp. UC242_47]|uniref:2-hydroxychromene-2-carboxylate isomerase n=1 Tax=Polaromonas sp. UC242_47 TaxID=3374626 RepID=UPI0037B94B3C
MVKTVDFYFDFGSPAAYLAWTQLPQLCADTGARLIYKPVLLGGIFQATGNRAPISVPLKGSYLLEDLGRFAQRYQVAFKHNPFFPINTITLMRIATGLQMCGDPRFETYVKAMFEAMWIHAANMGDPATLAGVLAAAGIHASDLVALATDPAVKEQLRADTEAAVARGIFGAPTLFVGEKMYWGQDRLDFVREALIA